MEQLQKEILKEVVKKSDEITIEDIRQNWELFDTIERKREKFKNDIQGYQDELILAQSELRNLRLAIQENKQSLQTMESQILQKQEELQKLNRDLSIKQVQYNAKQQREMIQENRSKILPAALKSVSIYLKDGSIAKVKPAQKVFSEDIYKKYRVQIKENHILKSKISDLELENKRLQIELRDFYTELKLEGMGAITPLDEEISIQNKQSNTNNSKDIQNLSSLRLKEKPKTHQDMLLDSLALRLDSHTNKES